MNKNLSAVMKRAWEIKKEFEQEEKRVLSVRNELRELKEEEKAVFSVCLKMAWAEARKAATVAEKYNVSFEDAMKIVAQENRMIVTYGGTVTWRIWRNYGKARAYYTCSGRSKYQNNKKDNYIDLAA